MLIYCFPDWLHQQNDNDYDDDGDYDYYYEAKQKRLVKENE